MADSTTTNYGLTKPEVGGSSGSWGTKQNADLDTIDTTMKANEDAAAAAQTAADDAQTSADTAIAGKLEMGVTAITLTAGDPYVGSIDLAVGGPVYRITQSHGYANTDCQITFTNRPVGYDRLIYLHFLITATLPGGNFIPTIQSASKQWALPLGQQVTGSGTQIVYTSDAGVIFGYIEGTRQLVVPVLIIGS